MEDFDQKSRIFSYKSGMLLLVSGTYFLELSAFVSLTVGTKGIIVL